MVSLDHGLSVALAVNEQIVTDVKMLVQEHGDGRWGIILLPSKEKSTIFLKNPGTIFLNASLEVNKKVVEKTNRLLSDSGRCHGHNKLYSRSTI